MVAKTDKHVIAVDCDDVLVPNFQQLITWYNRKYGTRVTLAHNNDDNPRPWGTETIPEAVRRVHGFFESAEFLNAEPYEEAIKTLKALHSRYALVLITARDTIIEEVTRLWLEKHFQGLFREAHFTAHYSLEGKQRRKGDVLATIGADYLIDDSLHNILEAAEAGVQPVLFGDYPWNGLVELPGGVVRCKNWQEVEEYFDGQVA